MSKRLFQILDELNKADEENSTRHVGISNTLVRANKVNQGAEITLGADMQSLTDLMDDTAVAILVIVNRSEYERVKSINPQL